ncbi:MAG: hypothetical protein U0Q15_09925 [Kineosporiaceae bacterium]
MATLREDLGRTETRHEPRHGDTHPTVGATDTPTVVHDDTRAADPYDGPVAVPPTATPSSDVPEVVTTPSPATPDTRDDVREEYEQRVITRRARTSGVAALSLSFGLASAFCAVVVIFAPIAVLLGLVAVVLGVASWRITAKPGLTGRLLGVTGALLGLAGAVFGAAVVLGVTTVLNDQGALDRLERRVEQLRDQLPSVDVDVQR